VAGKELKTVAQYRAIGWGDGGDEMSVLDGGGKKRLYGVMEAKLL
jgi:hypothetical protein